MTKILFDGFKKTGIDSKVDDLISAHIQKHKIDSLTVLKNFPVLIRRQSLKRFLSHVDLFRLAQEIPGDIAELGVFQGLGLMTWANLLEAYSIGDRTKTVYGFDNWKGFTEFSPEDGAENFHAHKMIGEFNPQDHYEALLDSIEIFDQDRFIPWKPRIKLVSGQIEETVPFFLDQNPGVRFSLIHFDCDLYAPTKIALEALWPHVSRGGVLIFDEYAIADWPGETKAVDEFIADKPDLKIKTFSWTNTPGGYLIKP